MQASLLFVFAGLAGSSASKSIWIDSRAVIAEQSPAMELFISVLYLCLVSFCMRVLSYPGQLLLYCEIIFWSWSFMQIDQMCSFDQLKGVSL